MYTRSSPFISRIKSRHLLTKPNSSKKTFHVVLDALDPHLNFNIGDSIAIAPANDLKEVDEILHAIKAQGSEIVFDSRGQSDLSIRDFLLYKANLTRANTALFKLLLENGASHAHLAPLLEPENKGQLTEFLHSHSLLELLTMTPLSPSEIARTAMPLLPRFYSIANSPKMFPNEIHLTVAYLEYYAKGKVRRGVGSHFLCDLATLSTTPIPLYVQPSNHFTLPQDKGASIILVGPGTGIAPFRAFLQERLATQAEGRNWLFFGERNRATDFYYEDFWTQLETQGRLRLTTAFSRDSAQKVYVQHKMYEERKSLWEWIQEGAYFYVCGDANKMAKDVEETLLIVVREEGGFTEENARLYIKKLKSEKRYLTDVY